MEAGTVLLAKSQIHWECLVLGLGHPLFDCRKQQNSEKFESRSLWCLRRVLGDEVGFDVVERHLERVEGVAGGAILLDDEPLGT